MANALENPFLTVPQVPGPQSRSWGSGFAFGFKGPARSSMAPADIQPEDPDAFNQGVLAGETAAADGVALSLTCVDLHAEGGIGPHLLLEAPEGAMWIADIAEGLAAGIGGGVLLFINLSIALETFTDDPTERLSAAGNSLQTQIQSMGFADSMEMFIGGGVDVSAAGCELKLTPIFAGQDAAVAAAQGLGRPHWLVASWRTDQCGGAKVVANSD